MKRKMLVFLLATMLSLSWGCLPEQLTDKSSPQGTETAVTTELTETTTAATSASETEASGSGAAVDKELGIDYPRPTGDPAVSSDSKDDAVRWLQSALNQAMHAGLTVDGNFENGTESKVKEFQSRCGLKASGQADAETIAMLVDIVSGKKEMPEAPKATSTSVTTSTTAQSTTTKPVTTKPAATQPPTTKPVATKPAVTQPPTTKPVVTKPAVTQPPTTKPAAPQPPTTKPVATNPAVTQPPTTKPVVTQAPTTKPPTNTQTPQQNKRTYVLNTNTKKFHDPGCPSVNTMSEKNKLFYTGSRNEVIAMGYDPCKRCNS